MSDETRKPLESEPQENKSSRRELLTSVLLGLGASVLLQPNGGVAEAQDHDHDEGKKKGKKGKKKKKSEEPKKEG